MRKTLTASLVALTAALNLGSLASAAPAFSPESSASSTTAAVDPAQPKLQLVQYGPNRGANREHGRGPPNRDAFRARSYWDRRHGNGYYDRTYGGERRDDSSAVASGFLGFVLGAAIAGSANDRNQATTRLNDRTWTASCAQRYRSFDAHSGTYLGNDGYRHYCR